ncbi:MAG: COG4315 family predicted lipoprotein, partial [Gemmatimonadota bacterium]
MTNVRPRSLLVVSMLALVTLSACSDGEDDDGTADGQESPAAESPAAESTLAADDSDLGEIVVDDEGQTLYVFLADEGGESTCYDDCEESWPPLTVEGDPVAGEGIDGSLLGTTEREDGSTQVTLDGQPLYYFAADESPGDTNGQA